MSISSVVTRGYGSWGSVNDVVTRGYSIGEIIAPILWLNKNAADGDWSGKNESTGTWLKKNPPSGDWLKRKDT